MSRRNLLANCWNFCSTSFSKRSWNLSKNLRDFSICSRSASSSCRALSNSPLTLSMSSAVFLPKSEPSLGALKPSGPPSPCCSPGGVAASVGGGRVGSPAAERVLFTAATEAPNFCEYASADKTTGAGGGCVGSLIFVD